MSWDQEAVAAAADHASYLSELLESQDFYKDEGLRRLTQKQIQKFLSVLDESEAARLHAFARCWHYGSDEATWGFPLLDGFWALADAKLHFGWDTRRTDEANDWSQFMVELARLNPRWLLDWWYWGLVAKDRDSSQRILEFLVPPFSRATPPLDVKEAIEMIADAKDMPVSLTLLNSFVTNWEREPNFDPDPVAIALASGDRRLNEILRFFWSRCVHPNPIEKGLGGYWFDGIHRFDPAVAVAVGAAPVQFRLETGFSVGIRIAERGVEPTAEATRTKLSELGIQAADRVAEAVFRMVELWATLRKLADFEARSWEHKTELVGLRAKVASLASAAPELWAEALPWILVRASAIGGLAQSVTLDLATVAPEVQQALDVACDSEVESVRLLARGLCTLLLGLDDPGAVLARTLADVAAHHMDGTPIFPHPLAPVSATWLGSSGVEHVLRDGMRRAAERFAGEVRDQGGDIEETLTKALVKEIEFEFRETKPRQKWLGSAGSRSSAPVLSVHQRPTSKTTEEPIYGCDIAWLLRGTVPDRYKAEWVDLVQVKKSTALHGDRTIKARADSWRIDRDQLDTILKWSATAAYWLIASAGEVLVIPARHLLAIRRGNDKREKSRTFTVGYHEVRSAAIPLEQYLVDLLIGQWVGTSSEDVLEFALGGNSRIRPRVVVEVMVLMGGSDNHQER